MSKTPIKQNWILLIHQLPPKPTNLRVRVWRKLQRLGAAAIKNSVYVLPFSEKTEEDFQWLKQEIETVGGEAAVFRAASVEGATDREVIAVFQSERNLQYEKLAAEYDALAGAVKEQTSRAHLTVERAGRYETELGRLHAELEHLNSIDFFHADQRVLAVAADKRCRKALSQNVPRRAAKSAVSNAAAKDSTVLSRADYQSKRWVTRRNLHIDRLACAWLIKRFIDERPRFYFVAEGEKIKNAVRFDMFGAEFTHVGEDCTFETLIKQFGFTGDKGLCEIAEIVHDIDLKDNKFNRLEAAGLDQIVRGLALLLDDDRKLLANSTTIFDGLYEKLKQTAEEKDFQVIEFEENKKEAGENDA